MKVQNKSLFLLIRELHTEAQPKAFAPFLFKFEKPAYMCRYLHTISAQNSGQIGEGCGQPC